MKPITLTRAAECCTPDVIDFVARNAFDYASELIERNECFLAFRLLGAELTSLYDVAAGIGALDALRTVARSHKLFDYCQQDPFTSRVFKKPRSYAGDAKTFDILYSGSVPDGTSTIGAEIFKATARGLVGLPIIFRKDLMRAFIDNTLASVDSPRILSLSSGHCRGLESSLIGFGTRNCDFMAVDSDPETCEILEKTYRNIRVRHKNVVEFLESEAGLGKFDLIYAPGLYDYTPDAQATDITIKLSNLLRPNGRVVLSGFSKECAGRAYMDLFMDWHPTYRSSADLRTILGTSSNGHFFSDPHKAMEYVVFDCQPES